MNLAFEIALLSAIFLLSLGQNSNFDFEVYEYDPTSGSLKPVTLRPNRMRTTRRYENNVFLNEHPVSTPTVAMTDRSNDISSDSVNCDSLLTFHNDFNGAKAELAIPPIFNRQHIYLKVFIKVATLLPSRYVGDISLVKDKQSTINDVANGLPILYRIRFPIQNPIPKLTAVYYNNQLICTGPHDVGEFVTTIQLDHTLYTGLSQQQVKPVPSYNNDNLNNHINNPQPQSLPQRPQPAPQPAPQPVQQRPQPVPQPQTQRPLPPVVANSAERGGEFSSQCGVPKYRPHQTTGLVFGGRAAVKGQFPWYAAFHYNGNGGSTGFICGGSLVSTKVVITAAHCVQDKGDANIRKPEESLFYFGKYYLTSQPNERDFIYSAVTQFIVHNDWQYHSDSYDADIAAAVLTRTIQFTNYIQPLCIWSASYSYHDILGGNGVVVGYGKTERDASTTDKPLWVELPVVDEGTCLRSSGAFSKITSKRTFCAGSRDGSGPCNGDSGGSFAVKSNGKWYLRGIVSSSLVDSNTYTCDTKNYAVYTDAAAFKDWILQLIERYG